MGGEADTAKACDPMTPLYMGFPRQEFRSGLPFPSPGDLPSHRSDFKLLPGSSHGGCFHYGYCQYGPQSCYDPITAFES